MSADAWIIDGYVDEPACLGVPPYISPYIRTIAGVLLTNGFSVTYRTIDEIRAHPERLGEAGRADLVVMIAGMTVPGKYLGGTPADWQEITQVATALTNTESLLGGPVLFGSGNQGGRSAEKTADFGFTAHLSGSPAGALARWLDGKTPDAPYDYLREDPWAVQGAAIIREHPSFPHVMCEIETARGCSREISGGCSFCTEPFYGRPVYRSEEGIIDEISALARAGARHFRIGRQPDILTWQGGSGEYPAPQPEKIRSLFSGIRQKVPDLRTLHIDNVNPGTIARHPEEAREALSAIVEFHTPGDVAAFGMETADPVVIEANNLKAEPGMVMEAMRIVHEIGSGRRDGIPELLPGLNFIAGLEGETPATYENNRVFLESVLDAGYLVRRVNIRQLMPFEGTRAYSRNALPVDQRQFKAFKEWTRRQFDLPMLRRVFPSWTVLRSVHIEVSEETSFGRQMGSYPILVGIPVMIPEKTVLDVIVVDHGMRSVTALPYPLPVNDLPHKALSWIPGISKKGLVQVLAKRPFSSPEAFEKATGARFPSGALTFTPREVQSP
ncbi:MAG: radical SAM protein [Methanospirillum sp.]|nr:radical SAM protein [Methanospirillum sp.]